MRIGYPCLNRSIGCTAASTFRLASLSEQRLSQAVENNVACTGRILRYNAERGLLHFRLTSDLVPFASHPACTCPWQVTHAGLFAELGREARSLGMRLSMHPGQYTLINAPDPTVWQSSLRELIYHAEVLDLMGMDEAARIQVHVGGVYGDRRGSIARFVERFRLLPERVRERLSVENDDVRFSLAECLEVASLTGTPVVYDHFHHQVLCSGETLDEALALSEATWRTRDGLPIVDYSSAYPTGRTGRHAETLDEEDLWAFLVASRPHDFDLMLEIKDKERSAQRALDLASDDPRLVMSPAA